MTESDQEQTFERMGDQKRSSLAAEFVEFLAHNKKWWLLPIVLAVGLVGLLAVFAGSGAGPFIYPLF